MIIRLENGKIADVYSGLSDDTIEQLKTAFEGSEFVETDELVNRGEAWPKVAVEPAPAPVPMVMPPPTMASIVAQLNTIVEQKKSEYLQRWPQASQVDLWPMFAEEITRLKTAKTVATPALYPVLAGALSVRMGVNPGDLSAEHITGFAGAIVGAKTAHAIELAKLESAYQATLMAWTKDPETNIESVFEVVYGA
jgi:hypothetical protein